MLSALNSVQPKTIKNPKTIQILSRNTPAHDNKWKQCKSVKMMMFYLGDQTPLELEAPRLLPHSARASDYSVLSKELCGNSCKCGHTPSSPIPNVTNRLGKKLPGSRPARWLQLETASLPLPGRAQGILKAGTDTLSYKTL